MTDGLGRYYDDDDAGVMVDKTWMNDKSNWGRFRNYMFVVMTIVTLRSVLIRDCIGFDHNYCHEAAHFLVLR